MSEFVENVEMRFDNFTREINVEVVKEKSSTIKREFFENQILSFLQEIGISHAPVKFTKENFINHLFLDKNVVSIYVC